MYIRQRNGARCPDRLLTARSNKCRVVSTMSRDGIGASFSSDSKDDICIFAILILAFAMRFTLIFKRAICSLHAKIHAVRDGDEFRKSETVLPSTNATRPRPSPPRPKKRGYVNREKERCKDEGEERPNPPLAPIPLREHAQAME